MEKNELVWKLLKHREPDAWKKPTLTQDEKAALVYAGQQDSSKYNVFMDGKQPDVLVDETTLLRIMPHYAIGLNRTIGLVVSMEIYSHYKINHLSNYTTRVDAIAEELLGLFNGVDTGGLGLLTFSKMADQSALIISGWSNSPFGGKQIIFSTYSAS